MTTLFEQTPESAPLTPVQKADLNPRSGVRRTTAAQIGGLLLAGLAVLLFLTTRYAYRSLEPTSPATARPPIGPPPIDPDVLERGYLRSEEPPLPEPEPEPAYPPQPPLARPSASDRDRIFAAPLAVHRPARRGGEAEDSRTESLASALGIDPKIWSALSNPNALGSTATPLSLGVLGPHAPFAAGPLATAPPSSSSSSPPGAPTAARAVLTPAHRFDVAAGTVIPAVLQHRHVSDGRGLLRAQIAQDVLDTQTASHVLIPKGTVALGEPVGEPSASDPRIAVAWTRLRFPDGRTLTLPDTSAAASDGSSGLPGSVDRHFGRQLGAAVLLSLVGAGVQLSQPQRSSTGLLAPSESQLAAGELGLQLGRLSQRTLDRLLDLPPTVTLEPGAPVFLLLARDLVFDGPSVP